MVPHIRFFFFVFILFSLSSDPGQVAGFSFLWATIKNVIYYLIKEILLKSNDNNLGKIYIYIYIDNRSFLCAEAATANNIIYFLSFYCFPNTTTTAVIIIKYASYSYFAHLCTFTVFSLIIPLWFNTNQQTNLFSLERSNVTKKLYLPDFFYKEEK